MSRWGYLIIAALVAALAAYALWPSALAGDLVELGAPLEPPPSYVVHAAGLEQQVDGEVVRIGALTRPLDHERAERLWATLHAIAVQRTRMVPSVAEGELGAYGIDGARAIDAAGFRVRWGSAGGTGYVWDGRRLFLVPLEVLTNLDKYAARLDQRALLPRSDALERIAIGDWRLERSSVGWRDAAHPQRPGLTVRASRLLGLITELRFEALSGVPTPGEPRWTLMLAGAPPLGEHRLAIGEDGESGWARLDELPAQRLDAPHRAAWAAMIAGLGRDQLLDVDPDALLVDTVRFSVSAGGQQRLAVERRQVSYRPGETEWEVSWPGGRERASEEALRRALHALAALTVEEALPGPEPVVSPLAVAVKVELQNGNVIAAVTDGVKAWTGSHHGLLAQPTTLHQLLVTDVLDPTLMGPPAERLCKLQRVGEGLREVVARGEDGVWRRTLPAGGAVDAVAIGRLARALCAARAASTRLVDDDDRRALERHEFELDARFAPRAEGAPSMEIADERDTVPQDRGLVLYRDGAGAWRAVDVEAGVSYAIDAELAELARRPFESDAVVPIVPSLVRRIEVSTRGERFALESTAGSWQLATLASSGSPSEQAPPEPADEVAVRRLLRELVDLRALARESGAPLLPSEAVAVVTVTMPSPVGDDERVALLLGASAGGACPASVTSTRPFTGGATSRVRVPSSLLDDLQRARFRREAK